MKLGVELLHVVVAVVERGFQLFAVDGGHAFGDELRQSVALAQRKLLYARHVLYGRLCGHGTVGDNMRHIFLAVFFRHIAQHIGASVVVEVNINIGERYTVWVKESLEQQVVFHGVNLGDSQTVGHAASGCRPTAGSHTDTQLFSGCSYKVLHYKEVSWETHSLHYVQLELYQFLYVVGEGIAVAFPRSFVGEFLQIVGFEFYTVEFLVAAEFLYFGFGILLAQDHVAVFVLGEFVEKVFLSKPFPILCLGAEFLGYGEGGHDGAVVKRVGLYFVKDFKRVG